MAQIPQFRQIWIPKTNRDLHCSKRLRIDLVLRLNHSHLEPNTSTRRRNVLKDPGKKTRSYKLTTFKLPLVKSTLKNGWMSGCEDVSLISEFDRLGSAWICWRWWSWPVPDTPRDWKWVWKLSVSEECSKPVALTRLALVIMLVILGSFSFLWIIALAGLRTSGIGCGWCWIADDPNLCCCTLVKPTVPETEEEEVAGAATVVLTPLALLVDPFEEAVGGKTVTWFGSVCLGSFFLTFSASPASCDPYWAQ